MNNILYICGRVVRIDPLMNEETRTPLPTTFCSGLQKTGKMKTINLSQGMVALVDDWNYNWLDKRKWHVIKPKKTYYAVSHKNRDGKCDGKHYYMHREIMNPQKGQGVDHIDHNGLNCQEYNMRNCTIAQNNRNTSSHGNSKYLGVSIRSDGRITAQIQINYRQTYIGIFRNEIDAARAYDVKAKELFGEFANLNFKDQ